MSNSLDQFDLYLIRHFFDERACRELIDEMRNSEASPAVTYGQESSGRVNERVRRVSRVSPSTKTLALVTARLMAERGKFSEHFDLVLTRCEEPQFLCYRPGDFFVAHQDGNTGMLGLSSDEFRRVSVSIFLNEQSEAEAADVYCGGSLIFSDWRNGRSHSFKGEAGALVAFRAETTHEVTPITHGERYSIVTWFG